MERAFHEVFTRSRPEEAGHLDGRSKRGTYCYWCVPPDLCHRLWRVLTTRFLLSDLANPKTNWNKTPGYTEAECTAFAKILEPPRDARVQGAKKFVDMWRQLHPNTQHYTYFSYRFNCRAKGLGWRLDTCQFVPLFYYVTADTDEQRAHRRGEREDRREGEDVRDSERDLWRVGPLSGDS